MLVTKTTNRLHFEDLSPDRFEHLCTGFVYRMGEWKTINSFAGTGGDDGIDIKATELSTDKTWYIQCKRYKEISKAQLRDIIDKIIEKNEIIPDVILTIVACNVSKPNTEDYEIYPKSKGINEPKLITATVLEAMLYKDHEDLLFTYFGINLKKSDISNETIVKKRLQMKQKFKKEFTELYSGNSYDLFEDPRLQFKYSRVIIRDIEDKLFPGAEPETNIPGWFKYNLYDTNQEHFEVIIDVSYVLIDKDGSWDIISHTDKEGNYQSDDPREDNYHKEKVYVIGQIPYENIVAFDLNGDDYYGLKTIFCNFTFPNEFVKKVPMRSYKYDIIQEDTRNIRLDDEDRKNLE